MGHFQKYIQYSAATYDALCDNIFNDAHKPVRTSYVNQHLIGLSFPKNTALVNAIQEDLIRTGLDANLSPLSGGKDAIVFKSGQYVARICTMPSNGFIPPMLKTRAIVNPVKGYLYHDTDRILLSKYFLEIEPFYPVTPSTTDVKNTFVKQLYPYYTSDLNNGNILITGTTHHGTIQYATCDRYNIRIDEASLHANTGSLYKTYKDALYGKMSAEHCALLQNFTIHPYSYKKTDQKPSITTSKNMQFYVYSGYGKD